MNCIPSSRQSKKYKTFSASRYHLLADFYVACKYVSCFSIRVNTPRFQTAPYFAVMQTLVIYYTLSGVRINEWVEVQDQRREAIQGLYAALVVFMGITSCLETV